MVKIQDIDLPYLEYAEAAAPGTPAAGIVRQYAKTDGKLYSKDDAGTETLMSAGASLSNPMTTAGDIIYSSDGSGTPARLALGAAGGAVSRVNGAIAWNSGTAFPTAATGDRYWRTDRGLEYYYDGTRWLTTTQYREPFAASSSLVPMTATGKSQWWIFPNDYDVYVEKIFARMYSSSLTSGAYWTITAYKAEPNETETSLGTMNDQSGTNANYLAKSITVNTSLAAATYYGIRLAITKTSTPGDLYMIAEVVYRLVG